MIYLQITLCLLLAIVPNVRLMPIDVQETTTGTESTDDMTTEAAAVTTWVATEANTTEKGLVTTTTEEPFNTATDHEDPSVFSSSQNVEVRLHPQLLRIAEPKGSLPMGPGSQEELPEPAPTASTTTTTAAASDEDVYILGSKVFGRRMEVQPPQQQQQQQSPSFSVQTGRVRSKDSLGAALRRAVTGSPAVQKLQQSTSRMGSRHTPVSSARAKAGEITGRKIVGFGSLSSSNLPAPRLPSNSPVQLRKETFFKNRPAGQGGETPASTHIDPLSPHWLYGTSKDTRKSVDPFRLSSTERLLVLGLREKTLHNTTTSSSLTTEATTTASPATRPTTSTTKTVRSPTNESAAPINQVETVVDIESTTTRSTTTASNNTPAKSGVTPEQNYATPETNYATAEKNYATPEINYGTPETKHVEGHKESTTAMTTTTTSSTTETISTSSSTETNPFTSSKAKATAGQIPQEAGERESVKELDRSPLDGQQSPPKQDPQELGVLAAGDDCFGADCNGDLETGLHMGELDNSEFDQDAHKYLVEEKTHDGYIIGEYGVISPSSDILRGVRYTAHGSTDPQLIQEMLRIFWSL